MSAVLIAACLSSLIGGGLGGAVVQWLVRRARRDQFAAHALAAIIQGDGIPYAGVAKHQALHAKMAFEHADAMIANPRSNTPREAVQS